MIKRISRPAFVSSRETVAAAIYWPLRPETPARRSAKLSQDRLPQSLHSLPQGAKDTKGEVQ